VKLNFNHPEKVYCNSDSVDAAQFLLIELGNNQIALKTKEDKYLSANISDKAQITAYTPWIGNWEIFNLEKLSNNKIRLKASNGKYVSFNPQEENALYADADNPGPEQELTVYPQNK
jgi:hypothetical protein